MPHSAGGLLALDLSSMVGWAYGHIDASTPLFGCWRLPWDGGEGARYAGFENELANCIAELAPSRMVLEASLSLAAFATVSTMAVVRQQLTLRGIAYAEAYRASVPISEVSAEIVRLSMMGTSRFAKGTAKREVVRYCKARGWNVPDHNSADACLTWAWNCAQLRGASPIAGPLFVEKIA